MTKFKADLGLMSITVFWGSTFIISKNILTDIPVELYLAIRFTVAAVLLNLIIIKKYKSVYKDVVRDGIILGTMLFFTFYFQMWGIQHTSASNAGFITGLSVILVPIIGLILLHSKPAINVSIAIIVALIGLLLLTGANPMDWNKGDYLVLICTIFVAAHILYTGRVAAKHNIYILTGIQLLILAVLSIVILLASKTNWQGLYLSHWGGLLYLAVFATVYTYLMQTSMQRFTTSTRTALIFALEPVFAALFAMAFSMERLNTLEWTGGLLIVMSMILAEIPFDKWKSRNKEV